MSRRVSQGGRLIDRKKLVRFTFNGRRLKGYAGDTLASALLGNGQTLLGRSFKYHRRRGLVAAGPEEPNALLTIGQGAMQTPNERATQVMLVEGLRARSQNHFPFLRFDLGAINDRLSRFFPAGFYYKTFIRPRFAWKWLYEPIIRRSAGLGRAPKKPDPESYEHVYFHPDIVIAGGGVAGLQAALVAAESGAKVFLAEQAGFWGGRAPVDQAEIAGIPAQDWVDQAVKRLSEMGNVQMRLRCAVSGLYDHGMVLACEQLSSAHPRQRLWRLRAGRVILATGAIERPLMFVGNDRPGVMLASAVRDYLVNYGVSAGKRCVIVTNNDDGYRTALALISAGERVEAVLDLRPVADGALADASREAGVQVLVGATIAAVLGKKQVEGVAYCAHDGDGTPPADEMPEEAFSHDEGDKTEPKKAKAPKPRHPEIACDVVAMSGGWSPAVHLWSHCGGKLLWDDSQFHFRPDPDRAPIGADGQPIVHAAGAAAGHLATGEALADGTSAALKALDALGFGLPVLEAPLARAEPMAPPLMVTMSPARAGIKARQKAFVDFQHDVKVSDIELAAREGYDSVEHAKRYTTLGMATDQGKLSNINGLSVLAEALIKPVPDVGTTTFRPPFVPVTFGAIAGEASGELFLPLRKTPLHDWHEAHGADFEPVGLWRRPYCYRRGEETRAQAVSREVLNTRQAVGILDASTLGKIEVSGPDAGRFLDMIYTNVMSNLPEGKCRYGLICSENGFLVDDGVVVRLGPNHFLCHTTSGGADRIHAMMEDWLQCEWPDWQVHVTNVTEQFGQIVLAGPRAREIMMRLGGMDLRKSALEFMQATWGELGGMPARVFRISFSGEVSFEIAVSADRTREMWDLIFARAAEVSGTGEGFELMPYGTEALHVMRAEKGYIMIGDETDGTVTPHDLGLSWAVSKKKEDFIGKRGLQRSHLIDPDRWQLVGLETTDGAVLPHGAYALGKGRNANRQRVADGRVTSSYYSPTLDRGIALGLVRRGPERLGEVLEFQVGKKKVMTAKIVKPVFHDPAGEVLDA